MQNLREFFSAFEHPGSGEVAYATLYAPTFLVAGAEGVRALTPEQLGAVASKRKALFEQLGRQNTVLASLEERDIDAHYVLTTTEWRWHFEPEGKAAFDITLPTTHIVHRSAEGWRIVFYRSGDVMEALKERGLIS